MYKKIFIWVLRLAVAAILLQTLFFKFSGAPESIYIFETLGIEPYGRVGAGIVELIASILILIPRTTLIGTLLGLGTMIGAILAHLTKLGIEVNNDGGALFTLAIITFVSCAMIVYLNREKIPVHLKFQI